MLEDSCFYSSVPAEAVTIAILKDASFHGSSYEQKVKSFKQCFYRNSVRRQKLQQVFEEQSFGLDTGSQSFCHSFIALSITRCSKSAQKFAVWVRQSLLLLKSFLSHQLRIE